MTAHLFFREDHLAVNFDIKDSFDACYQSKVVDNVLVILEQIGRRPDGFFTVVSRYTVGQRNVILLVHFILLVVCGVNRPKGIRYISNANFSIAKTAVFLLNPN